jgi:hypothetical protein
MRVSRVAASAVAAAVIVVGCASGGAPTSSFGPGASPGGASAASPTLSTSPSPPEGTMVWLPEWVDARTPDEVVNRRPLPLCGVEEAPVPRPGEFFDATVRNCFWAAKLDGRDAEFVSVQPTMEGDRIATIYCLGSDGRVDVFIDSTRDRFGGGGWTVTTCVRLAAEPGDRLFVVDGCEEPRPL